MNMLTYLNYYKDYSFEDIKFNDIDALLFSSIAYFPIDKIEDDITFSEAYDIINNSKDKAHGNLENKTIELIEIMKDSVRYKNVKLSNLVKRVDNKTQFGAITFRTKYFTFVGFEGTNSSMIGWVENFMLSLKFPTFTQELAINYLKDTVISKDKILYLGGHSKGGNLAMVSAYGADKKIFSKIIKIFNYDGPGFREDEFNTDRYKEVLNKTKNILPSGSVVGIMMENSNYKFIDADGTGFLQHNPYKWNVFGEFFIPGEQSKTSAGIQYNFKESLKGINRDESIILLNRISEYLVNNKIKYISDFKEMKYNDMMNMIDEYKDIDISIKKVFKEIFKLFFGNNK